MQMPEQHTRIVAGTPIEAGERRILPSVLVQTTQARWPGRGLFRSVKMRPVSVVVEGEEGAEWHEIPNATADAINTMAAVGLGVAVVGCLLLALSFLWRRP